MAAENGHTEVARLLLSNGADTILANKYLYTPLHLAARGSHLDLVKFLLEIGANPNSIDK
jgi:ankyrin repeat protein